MPATRLRFVLQRTTIYHWKALFELNPRVPRLSVWHYWLRNSGRLKIGDFVSKYHIQEGYNLVFLAGFLAVVLLEEKYIPLSHF